MYLVLVDNASDGRATFEFDTQIGAEEAAEETVRELGGTARVVAVIRTFRGDYFERPLTLEEMADYNGVGRRL